MEGSVYKNNIPTDVANVASSTMSIYLSKPAKRQVKKGGPVRKEMNDHSSEYNIWYNKRLGDRFVKEERMKATSRCNVYNDSGTTKANKTGGHAYHCLYFARGHCSHGPDCNFHHRIPLEEDEKKLDAAHDIFGRERHRNYRDDMGGVGSFLRDNRTLYIVGIKRGVTTEDSLMRHFAEFGELEYVRIIWDKAIGFVKYRLRSSAEFAKEAMTDQSLDGEELLSIKWSNEDPNPVAKDHESMKIQMQLAQAVETKRQQDEAYYQFHNPDVSATSIDYYPSTENPYPNTDTQYQDYSNSKKVITDWLTDIGLENYADLFISGNYLDLNQMSQLDEVTCDAIGIDNPDHRGRLLDAAADLRNELELKSQETQQAEYYKSLYGEFYPEAQEVQQPQEDLSYQQYLPEYSKAEMPQDGKSNKSRGGESKRGGGGERKGRGGRRK